MSISNNTKSKLITGAVVAITALSMVGGCFCVGKILDQNVEYKSIAKEFVEQTYQEEDNSLFLGEYNNSYLASEYKSEKTITYGEYIQEEIENRGILYCEFLDEYYTKNGMPIALIDTYLSEEGKAFYREIVVLDDLQEPFTLADNQYITIINTKPYSELKDMRLVVEMPTKKMVLNGQEELYEGTLNLKK